MDFYLPYQGEIPFVNLLKEVLNKGLDITALKSEPIDGMISYDKKNDILTLGNEVKRIKKVDDIPSPYLSGLLDKFFDTKLIPIVETNRGCPYTCTYCCQGLASHNQIEYFDLTRIKEELTYIANKVKNTNILIFADSNFGIAKRDIEVSKHIAKLTEEKGYPHSVSMNWAKNQPKIFEIAEILKNINLIISLQSLDDTVLKNIKRHNVRISVFKNIIDRINNQGGKSGTEIILGLPGETKESHLRTLRELFDWNVSYIICYNCLILVGSELSLLRDSGNFNCQTKFRLIDNSFGKYNGIQSFESEEGIRSTSTISEEEILYFRPVHWLIQFLWNYRFYYDLLRYIQSLGTNPLDYIIKLIDNVDNKAPESIKKIFKEFKDEAKEEWFDSPEILQKYYSQPENFEWLKKGNYGKMNSKYIFKVLLEAKEDFESYLNDVAINMCSSNKQISHDVLNYLSSRIIDFRQDWEEISREQPINLKYDILEWENFKYQKNLKEYYNPEGKIINLYLPSDQKQSLKILLKQYDHKNKNVTLRKMSEYMDIRDFFRKAR